MLIKLGFENYSQIIRFLVVIYILCEFIFYVALKGKVIIKSKLELLLITYLIIYSVFSIIIDVFALGSVLKYLLYAFIPVIVRTYFHQHKSLNLNTLKPYVYAISTLVVLISLFQTITNDTQLINLVNRVSGVYYRHASGLALFLVFPIGYFFFEKKPIIY